MTTVIYVTGQQSFARMIPVVINNNGRSWYGMTICEAAIQVDVGVIKPIIKITLGNLMK